MTSSDSRGADLRLVYDIAEGFHTHCGQTGQWVPMGCTMSAPVCTIVIPTFNRPQPLRDCLNATARLSRPEGGFEVLVVDDGGAASLAFVKDYADTRLHRQPNAGPASARNAGAARGNGQLLAFLDDDCCPQPDWLVRMVAAVQRRPDALAGGCTAQ